MAYNFDKKFQAGKYTVEVDTAAMYGYFEHDELGEDSSGGLWFVRFEVMSKSESGLETKLRLTDYDGVFQLPKRVIEGLRENGFVVD